MSTEQTHPYLGDPQLHNPERARAPIHVVIVDNHKQVREGLVGMASFVLDKRDSFSIFEDGEDALGWFEKNPQRTDIFWTDNNMSHMSGKELIQQVHVKEPGIVTVLATSDTEEFSDKSGEELQRMGISMLVDKGGSMLSAFEQAVAQVLQRREKNNQPTS